MAQDIDGKPFEDHFSRQARTYAQYRPRYPASLYAYLASLVSQHRLAWDCATGNGQAAVGLAHHFQRVAATDASTAQIANAQVHDRVWYWIGRAESVALPDASVNLVTVAQAVHWFDLDAFYREVQRVLNPGGVFAVWTYHLPHITPPVDTIVAHFYTGVTGPYWSPRMRYIDERYRTLPFPFDEITPPAIAIEATWNLENLLGFLASWSAVQSFIEKQGYHPLQEVEAALHDAWGDAQQKRTLRWPLHFRIGRLA